MGYQIDGLALYAEWRHDRDDGGLWATPDLIPHAVFEPVRSAGFLARTTHLIVGTEPPRAVASVEELAESAKAWRDGSYDMVGGDPSAPDWSFYLSLSPERFGMQIGFARGLLDGDTRELLATWIATWSDALAPRELHLSVAKLMPPTAPYPRPRPPRWSQRWPLGALDYYFGRAWHQREPERAEVLATVAAAPLHRGMHREQRGDALRVWFDTDLTDAAAIATTRERSEAWLGPLVPTEVERGWNELGDRLVPLVRPQEKDPFTLYDPRREIGYKAISVGVGEVDEQAWEELGTIAKRGQLPDGTPVKSIRLIFPVRDEAIRMHDRTVNEGFEMAIYPSDGRFWQVYPP